MNNNILNNNFANPRLAITAVLLLASLLGFWTLTETPLNNHECLVSVSAREMLESNDWILPTFNGEPRLQKTPLMYWLVAVTAAITGQVNEFSARTPSVLLAILSVVAILYFVRQWLDLRIACLSAAVWASTLGYMKYAQCTRPEMAMCSFITIAMLSFYSATNTQGKKRSVICILVFWLSFSLAMLAKGPAPLVLIFPPLFCYFLFMRKWKHYKKTMPIIGTIIFLAIFLPWPIMVLSRISEGGAFWKREFIDRFFGEYAAGHKPIWYYAGVIFSFSIPFSALVPYALISPFYKIWDRKRPIMWYLWLWVVVQILVMTISGGKRQHYILSAFPAFSILAGIMLNDMIFELKAFKAREVKTFFIAHIIAIIANSAALVYWAVMIKHDFVTPSIHISLMAITIITLVAYLFSAGKKYIAITTLFTGYCAIIMVVQIYFIAPLSYNNHSREFSKEIGHTVPASDKLVAFNDVSARTIQYAGRSIPEIFDIEQIYERYENGEWIIATGGSYDDLIRDGRFNVVFEHEKAERKGLEDVAGALLHKQN
ncbi:MAG: glycosyltransferase family 39 protein [Anaerohalosphaeraceae bacterium]|nr:glycosyltransferase family 39 protein [Anaerohalosphaeraceae bacterium]